ncbi:MAG: alpha/beta hydrolase [Acidobacteria bacterium]|nr:alpha/beta hydrolase [Acidobacteriota bacterium]
MAEASNDGLRIHYGDEGSGAPVLLIHGHTLDLRVWDDVAPLLTAAGLRVIRPDLRGHGRSEMPSKGYHWSHHAADMEAVLEDAAVEHATVVGFSLGGGVALEMAVSHPKLVERLVLMSPVMPDRPFEPAFLDNLKQVARVARSEGIGAAMAGPWAGSPLFARSISKPGVRERLSTIVADFPGADYLASERDHVDRGWTVPERLGTVGAATLVLVGGDEMAGFRAFAEEAAGSIPGARLEVLAGCGHLLPLEAPGEVAHRIIGHVAGSPPA